MDTLSTSSRQGTPGLDIFKIAGQSISGFLPSFKTGSASQIRQPFTSQLEERLAMYLEYHPHVRLYQRGDASEEFARARHLHTPLGTPYRIPYLYDGKAHDYLPDFVGTLCDGGLLIAEAGREAEKRKGQAIAKAEAAKRVAQRRIFRYAAITICLIYIHIVNLLLPTMKLGLLCWHIGLGARCGV